MVHGLVHGSVHACLIPHQLPPNHHHPDLLQCPSPTSPIQAHYAPTHALTHARPSLPVNQNTNPAPPNPIGIRATWYCCLTKPPCAVFETDLNQFLFLFRKIIVSRCLYSKNRKIVNRVKRVKRCDTTTMSLSPSTSLSLHWVRCHNRFCFILFSYKYVYFIVNKFTLLK